MMRFLIGLLFLASFCMALAQPPADYQLRCELDGEIIGVVSIVEDNVHVALLAGVDCYGYLDVTPDADFTVELGSDGGELVVTLFYDDVAYDTELITPDEVPQEALHGMVRAQENRAMAMGLREAAQEQAQERGAAMRPDVADDDELEEDADEGPPEWLELPEPARATRP